MRTEIDGKRVQILFRCDLAELHECLLNTATFSSPVVAEENNPFLFTKCPHKFGNSVRLFTLKLHITDRDVRNQVLLTRRWIYGRSKWLRSPYMAIPFVVKEQFLQLADGEGGDADCFSCCDQ